MKNLVSFFHKNTSLNKFNTFLLQKRINSVLESRKFIEKSQYPDEIYLEETKRIPLYEVNNLCNANLFECLIKRRSNSKLPKIRKELTFENFSKILKFAFGVSNVIHDYKSGNMEYQYTFPTEGGLNTIEVYIIVNFVENLKPGVYLYDPYKHSLVTIENRFNLSKYYDITGLVNQAKNSFFSVYYVGNGNFSFKKYGARSYRFMNIEAGHCSQNLYLVTTALGLECAASGAFFDDDFFDFLKIPSKNRFLLYENFVGD